MKNRNREYTEATALELHGTALSLLNLCAKDGGGQGGIASGVGPNADIGVILRPYDPSKVDCGESGKLLLPRETFSVVESPSGQAPKLPSWRTWKLE